MKSNLKYYCKITVVTDARQDSWQHFLYFEEGQWAPWQPPLIFGGSHMGACCLHWCEQFINGFDATSVPLQPTFLSSAILPFHLFLSSLLSHFSINFFLVISLVWWSPFILQRFAMKWSEGMSNLQIHPEQTLFYIRTLYIGLYILLIGKRTWGHHCVHQHQSNERSIHDVTSRPPTR